ncbi:MAG: hypothetical protein Q4C53_02990 [Clostridia bacterium]|nr:hypothetical protein [Clostridia bacterium]
MQNEPEFRWEYTLPLRREKVFWILMGVLGATGFFVGLFAALYALSGPEAKRSFTVFGVLAFIVVAAELVGFLVLKIVRKGRSTTAYTADGTSVFCPEDFGEVKFASVRKLTRRRRTNAIELSELFRTVTVCAGDSDYERVWNFIAAHCPQAETEEG